MVVFLKKYQTFLFLTALVIVGFFLRFYLMPTHLFFGPEQGADFQAIRSIVYAHKLTLIGPKTDIQGVFHGPLYYYAAIPAVLTSMGDPIAVARHLIFLNVLTIYFIYLAGKQLFSKRVGLIAALLFTFSFEAIVAPRWLAGQPLAIPLVSLLFYFLAKYLKGHSKSLFGVVICFGLISQVQFLNFILFSIVLLVVILVFFRRIIKTPFWVLALCCIGLITLPTVNFLLFDMRHNFLVVHGVLSLFSHHTGYYLSYRQFFISLERISRYILENTFLPFTNVFAEILFLILLGILIYYALIQKRIGEIVLALWFVVPVCVLFFIRHDVLTHYFLPLIPAILLLVAYCIDALWQRKAIFGYVCLALFLLIHTKAYALYIPLNENIFFQSTQSHFYLSDEKKAIDIIYKASDGKAFAYQAYTIPYLNNQNWDYLFWQYGEKKYGPAPIGNTAPQLFVIQQSDPGSAKLIAYWLSQATKGWRFDKKLGKFGDVSISQYIR